MNMFNKTKPVVCSVCNTVFTPEFQEIVCPHKEICPELHSDIFPSREDMAEQKQTLKSFLRDLKVELDEHQEAILDALENGQGIMIYDTAGTVIRRYKQPRSIIQSPMGTPINITTGDIIQDSMRFLKEEYPRIVKEIHNQVTADELYIYLKSRGWTESESINAVQEVLARI